MITRLHSGLWLALTAAALGCGTSSPPPAPQPAPATVTESPPPEPQETAPQPVVIAPPVTPVTPVTPAPMPSASPQLRELVAHYLASDGAGGFRPDERKGALELEKAAPMVTDLLPLLADPQDEVRRGAAFYLLGTFDAASPEQVTAFTNLLEDRDRPIRGMGLSAVKQMKPQDQLAALPKLAAAAEKDPDPKFRSACLVTIGQVTKPEVSVPLLVKGLSDKDAAVRLVATARLKALGPDASAAVKQLAAALEDSDGRVRDGAGKALIEMGGPAVNALATKLATGNLETRKLALACLAKIGPYAKTALPAVEKCLTDPDPQVKQLAEVAVRNIKGGGE